MSSLRKSLKNVYVSQTDDHCQKAKSQWTENMLQRMAVSRLILHFRIKGRGTEGYLKFLGGLLGRREKAKWENLRLHKK